MARPADTSNEKPRLPDAICLGLVQLAFKRRSPRARFARTLRRRENAFSLARSLLRRDPLIEESEGVYPARDIRGVEQSRLQSDDPGGVLNLSRRSSKLGPLELGDENVYS
jgi:hypothetical protein